MSEKVPASLSLLFCGFLIGIFTFWIGQNWANAASASAASGDGSPIVTWTEGGMRHLNKVLSGHKEGIELHNTGFVDVYERLSAIEKKLGIKPKPKVEDAKKN